VRSMSVSKQSSRSGGRALPSRRSATSRAFSAGSRAGREAKPRRGLISKMSRAILGVVASKPALSILVLMLTGTAVAIPGIGGYAHRASLAAGGLINTTSADAGLEISTIQLSGNHYTPPGAISAQLGFHPGESIFTAVPRVARVQLLRLDWIKDAQVTVRYPDAVSVQVVEKVPFALWQSDRGLYAVESDGRPITMVDATRFKRLPFFFGDAPTGASQLVRAIRAHRAISARLRAMQRVANRRWNLVLDDGVVVKLPEDNWEREIAALDRLIIDNGVLERDIGEIDLRSHDNYVFVLRHVAPRKSSRGEPT
jgi:cell division protein FtsQ